MIKEEYDSKLTLVNESIAGILSDVKKKMEQIKLGIPYRDSRLFFYEFLKDKHPDYIPDEFKQKFASVKPQGKDVNAMMGAMVLDEKLPKNIIDSLGKEFTGYANEKKKVGDKETDNLNLFLNKVAGSREWRGTRTGVMGGEKKEYMSPEDIKKVTSGEIKEIKKGSTGFETLKLNLDPETEFKFTEDAIGGKVFTAKKDNHNYRVTLSNMEGDAFKLKDLTSDKIKSVVVTEPHKKETFETPTGAKAHREKSVADFPPYGTGDYKVPDPEELAHGKGQNDYDEYVDTDEDEKEEDELNMGDKESMKSKQKMEAEEDCEYGIPSVKKDKLATKINNAKNDNESMMQDLGDTEKPAITNIVKKSPQQVNKELQIALRNRMKKNHSVERRYTLGY
jgi:hypothetical protein